jgi:hypothetical protein
MNINWISALYSAIISRRGCFRIMTEGKGYSGRRQERKLNENLAKLIKNKDRILVIPDDLD